MNNLLNKLQKYVQFGTDYEIRACAVFMAHLAFELHPELRKQ